MLIMQSYNNFDAISKIRCIFQLKSINRLPVFNDSPNIICSNMYNGYEKIRSKTIPETLLLLLLMLWYLHTKMH